MVEGADARLSPSTLLHMTRLAEQGPVVPYLREVALSDDFAAYRAVELLVNQTGPAGQEVAKTLAAQDLVTHPFAREMLIRMANARGWEAGESTWHKLHIEPCC